MKKTFITAAPAVCFPLTGTLFAQANLKEHPAYLDIDAALDLKVIKPEVNINIPRFLLNSALSAFNGKEGDPIAKLGINLNELTQDVKLIRVVVIEVAEETQKAFTRGVALLRAELEENWTPIVSVPEDGVFIYARSDESGEELAGIALLVAEDDEAVIGNLVGNVPLGKIAKIAAQLGEDMVPPELLQTLGALHAGGIDHHDDEAHGFLDGEAAHDHADAGQDAEAQPIR